MPQRSTPPPQLAQVLASDPWFGSCPADLRQALFAPAQVLTLARGEALFERGADDRGLCCVLAGALQVGSVAADGTLNLLAMLEPYQWFGEISLIDGQPRTHQAVAETEAQVLMVPAPALEAWLAAHPIGWRHLARLACAKLRTAFSALEDPGHGALEQRAARRLLLLAEGFGSRPGAPRTRLRLAQDGLAAMLGVSRQSVNKALRALAAQGLIRLHYGEVELLDAAALRRLGAG